ncbi:MAG: TIGR02996 domain-containing protein [Planctomycetia bacterium]|nr:TIGR02996 domain-containing protein [Planctomycetia bacterium]
MKNGQSHLQAILDSPDDDAPRLAYANRLKRSGDADRAEFIRIQCALDKLSPQAKGRPALEAREKELLDQYGWDWAKEFGTSISEWVYRRGFIERVQMRLETPAEEIRAVLSKSPIRHIRDTGQCCELKGVVEALPLFDNLTGLEFWGLYAFDNSLVAKMLASRHLRKLRTLILHHDRNGNLVQEKVLVEAMASPYRSNLVELGVNIDGCWRGPSNRILVAMAQSPYLKKLRKLHLSYAGNKGNRSRMNLKTARILGKSRNFRRLEEMDLGGASFPLEVWDEVLKWPWLSGLKWLRLHYARQVKAPDHFYTVARLEELVSYREAFETHVDKVDWSTEFVSPWDGKTCWRGLTWQDQPKRLLFGMNRFVRSRDYAGLESEYRRLCKKLAGQRLTKEIDALPFQPFEKGLLKGLKQAVTGLGPKKARTIYLRLRPDIRWAAEFHLQANDPQITEPQEEFSYEGPVKKISGPRLIQAAKIYAKHPIYSGTEPSGAALYLLARTIAAFGRCVQALPVAASVYFSCMYSVFCLNRGEAPISDNNKQQSAGSHVILNPHS